MTGAIFHRIFDLFRQFVEFLAKKGFPPALQAILLTGLVLGGVYTFIVPPWWHYDEPGHFEFAWLIANRYHIPSYGEYDAESRKDIAGSMIEYKWYSIRRVKLPDLNNNPVDIGVEQKGGRPLYYLYSAIPLQFVKNADMAVQNRAARLGSVALFLGVLIICWKIMDEILPANHPLQWMTTAFVATLPGLLDTMTSINDDAGAVFVYSLFLLYAVRIIKKGFSYSSIAGFIISLLLCYYTKNTTWFSFLLAPLVLLQGLLKQRLKWLPWSLIIGLGVAGLAAMFSWGDALYWVRNTPQKLPTRAVRADAPLGSAVVQIDAAFASNNRPVGQFISSDAFYELRGKTLSLGAWMWADRPTTVQFPVMAVATFDEENRTQYQPLTDLRVSLTTQPVFYKTTFIVPDTAIRGWIFLNPLLSDSPTANLKIYYDGLILVTGDFSADPPRFDDATATTGIWDDKKFTNLIRNASAETAGPRVYPWVDEFTRVVPNLQGRVSIILDAFIDQAGTNWYFRSAFSSMFQTFWSKFAAGKVFLLSFYAYEILQYLTLLALAGIAIRLIHWKTVQWDIALLFSLSIAFIWASALLRGVPELYYPTTVIPWARYALPSIIPVAFLLCTGWLNTGKALRRIGVTETNVQQAFFALMISLNIFTMLSITTYFSDQSRTAFNVLFIITLFAAFCAVWLIAKIAMWKPDNRV